MKLEVIPCIDSCDENSQDQKNMHDILDRLDEMQTMLYENQQLAIENLVLVEFLRQLKLEAVGIAAGKKLLEKELESYHRQLSLSQEEIQKLSSMNGELTTKVNQGVDREEALKVETEDLRRQVNDLSKSTMQLEEEKRELEEDISLLLSETIYQSNLILVLEDVVLEKLSGAVKLNEDLEMLSFVKCKLEEEVREVGDKLKSTETENVQLKGLLENTDAELANVKDQLVQREKELLEAMLMISTVQNEKSELSKAVEDLECKYKETKAIEEDKDILWESRASTLFGDLQISVVRETLLEGLVRELGEAYKSLEERSTLKDVEVEQLKGRVSNLEEANKGQSDLMSKYAQAIILLKESIESLEKHIDMPHEFENEPAKGTASMVDNSEGVLELQAICLRIKAIEETVTEKLAVQELKTASISGSLLKQQAEESEMITKDILLDQVSDCSSYGISKRDILKTEDDHSLEVKPQHHQKGKSMSEESLVVDKLEVSDRFTDPNKEVNKRKVLERLDSDLQKLSNLHIAVEDLKSKVEREEKGKEEYETVKGQINEADEALEKLLSINKKLVTKVVSGFEVSDGSKSSMDLDEDENSRRRRISEQARRGSEKIGRLQLEIQRLQFLLLKLEGEREDRMKAKVADSKTRTLLKDYIYGGEWLEKSSSLVAENQKIKEASQLLEKLVSELEQENIGKQVQIESSINCIKILRAWIFQVLMKLEVIPCIDSCDENSQDQKNMHDILDRLDEMQTMLYENQQLAIENLVLVEFLRQLKLEAVGIAAGKKLLEKELESYHRQLSLSQEEIQKLSSMNGELTTKVNQGVDREQALKVETEDLGRQVNDLSKSTMQLEEEKRELEEDISLLLSESIYQSSLILLLEDVVLEKLSGAVKLNEDLEMLSFVKSKLEEEVREVGDKLKSTETENVQLKGLLENTDAELANVKDQLVQKEKELLEAMLLISTVQNEKSGLSEAVEDLECKYKETKATEEDKDKQLSKEKNEVELWESRASTLFGDLQISVVRETLLEGLVRELAEAYKSLEERSTLKDVEVEQLKGRVNNLEDANKGQSDLMSKYAQAIILLKESLESLESHIDMPHEFENGPAKDTDSLVDNSEGVLELQGLCLRIKAIEETVTEKLAVQEIKPAAGRSRSGSLRRQNNETYSEESEMITKDIVLDQVSDCSSYGISKRDILKTEDDQSLEVEPQHPQKGKSMSEESLVVDKLEVSDRFTDPNKEVNKRKVLERLDSDLQKLANLHIAVEDLKSKVEREEKGKEEYESVKGQISEAEEALEKLLSINKKLVTKVVSGFEVSDGSKSSMDLDEDENSRRRRISEQARRGSEKIGRLQLEIQRLQFLLLKLEGEREDRVKAKVSDSKTRTLLKDYIYGGVRGERRKRMKKRFAFCGCVQQPPPSP
ncbi:hypothetical protein F2Q70_00042172 [Brassica cretica]|uniref:NAB domain-containing protein n=1 Tax=Brassica cretica TaxID=69181 RepID=A0A8S9K598_BRACR|nr:hypothetical protein F2Q70_00042172 [Brassica cretica]